VNPEHENLCASPKWAAWLQSEILPAVTAGIDLGKDILEIGLGPRGSHRLAGRLGQPGQRCISTDKPWPVHPEAVIDVPRERR
jgi:hypothetical protein